MRRHSAFAVALAVGFIAVNLAGCGTKGPLTLPQNPKTPTSAATSAAPSDLNTTEGRAR